MLPIPTKFFLIVGKADGNTPLNAFDLALLDSGIGNTNLIKVSSILPPGAIEIEKIKIPAGSLLHVAYASIVSDMPNEVIAAAVAVAIPKDRTLSGVIMEYSSRGHKEDAEDVVRMMVEQAMTNRGYEIGEIKSLGIQHKVTKIGAAFAAVALYW